jgi:hypothetical protein
MSKTRHAQGRHVPLPDLRAPRVRRAPRVHDAATRPHEAEPILEVEVETEAPWRHGPGMEQRSCDQLQCGACTGPRCLLNALKYRRPILRSARNANPWALNLSTMHANCFTASIVEARSSPHVYACSHASAFFTAHCNGVQPPLGPPVNRCVTMLVTSNIPSHAHCDPFNNTIPRRYPSRLHALQALPSPRPLSTGGYPSHGTLIWIFPGADLQMEHAWPKYIICRHRTPGLRKILSYSINLLN